MSQHYSNPKRATDAHSLPDVETFHLSAEDFLNADDATWMAEDIMATLPSNTELWREAVTVVECEHCGTFEVPDSQATAVVIEDLCCPSCDRQTIVSINRLNARQAWFYWFCMPGCLPDSGVFGPFDTEAEAVDDARDVSGEDELEETEE